MYPSGHPTGFLYINTLFAEQVGLVVTTLWIYIRYVLGLTFGRDTGHPD
jgi:hypothetical protein